MKMKAAVYKKYGSPEVVNLDEIEMPLPKDNEILVKIFATTVNRTDSGFRSAEYFVSRFWSGLFHPKYQILGCEFAGIVHETGKNVSSFKKGDKVFGYNDVSFGGHAEYISFAENGSIALIPDNFDFINAAALTEGSHYALNNIKMSKISKGQNALVYGATGAIGSAAVQLLKYFEINVTAVCNSKNTELVRSLGADSVIDYQTQDYTATGTKFHLIFDAVGKSSFSKCKRLLTKNGIYVSTELGKCGSNIFLALFTPLFGGKKVIFPIPEMNKSIVSFIKEIAAKGKFKPVIDRTYHFDQIVEAHKYVDSGQKTGNVVIIITNDYFK